MGKFRKEMQGKPCFRVENVQGFRTKTEARKAIPQMVAEYKGKVDIKTVDDYWKLFCSSAYLNLSKASHTISL